MKQRQIPFIRYLTERRAMSPKARIMLMIGGTTEKAIMRKIDLKIVLAEQEVVAAYRQLAREKKEHAKELALSRTRKDPQKRLAEIARYVVRVEELRHEVARMEAERSSVIDTASNNRDWLSELVSDWGRYCFEVPEPDPQDWNSLGNGGFMRKEHGLEY